MSDFTKLVSGVFFAGATSAWAVTGPYVAKIAMIQASAVGNPYHTVHLAKDVTDSPCASTNALNRFVIGSDAQHSVALSALMADKTITIFGSGVCNSVGIETIGDIRIYASK